MGEKKQKIKKGGARIMNTQSSSEEPVSIQVNSTSNKRSNGAPSESIHAESIKEVAAAHEQSPKPLHPAKFTPIENSPHAHVYVQKTADSIFKVNENPHQQFYNDFTLDGDGTSVENAEGFGSQDNEEMTEENMIVPPEQSVPTQDSIPAFEDSNDADIENSVESQRETKAMVLAQSSMQKPKSDLPKIFTQD